MLIRITVVALLATTFASAAEAQDLVPGDATKSAASEARATAVEPQAADDVEITTDAPPEPEEPPSAPVAPPRAAMPYGIWDRLAMCESGGNWASRSNPIYKGGLQFDAQTWARHGGLAYAWRADYASRDQQIAVAQRTLAVQGPGAWPVCSRVVGLRR